MKKSLSEKEHRENLFAEYNYYNLYLIALIAAVASFLVAIVVIDAQLGLGSYLADFLFLPLVVVTIVIALEFYKSYGTRNRIRKELGILETLKRIEEGSVEKKKGTRKGRST